MLDKFDDIRPFKDEEVSHVIKRLLTNADFIKSLGSYRLPLLTKYMPNLANKIVSKSLDKKIQNINSIKGIQDFVSHYLIDFLNKTSAGHSVTGLEEISEETPHLFISNHRDIVMDPAMVSFLLFKSIYGSVQIAIGDNLVKKDYVSDLMRLNKSFIVKRSVQGREKLQASLQLSEYIHHSIETGNNIWIAQREGRAKNGLDKTDPTILKMFHMANRNTEKNWSLKDSINNLHIIPVSISYEYDPCAELKARELYERKEFGTFEKDEESDLISISTGINGEKGKIHVSFGTEIIADTDDSIEIALAIDKQIIQNYKLHPSNYIAYEKLQKQNSEIGPTLAQLEPELELSSEKRNEFEEKLNQIAVELRPFFLEMYANPVRNKFQFQK
jgi:hypothetical protein